MSWSKLVLRCRACQPRFSAAQDLALAGHLPGRMNLEFHAIFGLAIIVAAITGESGFTSCRLRPPGCCSCFTSPCCTRAWSDDRPVAQLRPGRMESKSSRKKLESALEHYSEKSDRYFLEINCRRYCCSSLGTYCRRGCVEKASHNDRREESDGLQSTKAHGSVRMR
jgi:hypothetical protein